MPLYEFECRDCMKKYNKDITELSKSLDKKTAQKIMKRNKNFLYVEVQNIKNEKTIFELGKDRNKGSKRFRYRMEKDKLLSPDEEKVAQEHVQNVPDQHTDLVDDLLAAKEKELMTL